MTPAPPLYEEYQVLERLNLRGYELAGLLNVGIIAPVARGVMGQPLYWAETIDRLASKEQGRRLADALWWNFDLQRPGYMPGHLPWARAVDLPCYPFDNEEQQAWARRVYRLKKQTAPFPFPRPESLARYRSRTEDKATKAFEKAHGIKRPRKSRKLSVGKRALRRDMSRAEIRDLVWGKTMIRAANVLGISEFALRQLCKRLRIPLPTRGHFNHKNPKDRPPKPALPPLRQG